MISYAPFYRTLKTKKVSQYELISFGISPSTLNNIKHNRDISTVTINKLCIILNCKPNDVLDCPRTNEEIKILKKKKKVTYRRDLHKHPLRSDRDIIGEL